MRVYTKIIFDIATGAVVKHEGYEYQGPIAECISFGSSKSKQKSKQQSSSESGIRWNPDFLDRAQEFASGGTSRENFDPNAYLFQHPDVAASGYKSDPYQHWVDFGKVSNYGYTSKGNATSPNYDPKFVRTAPEGFDKLENTLYDTQASKLRQAYDSTVGRQREELAQSGALNSPSQYLEGSARSSIDRSFLENMQQAARDAVMGRLGLQEREAGRETTFNQDVQTKLLDMWLKKLALAIQSGQYSQASGESASSGGGGGFNTNFNPLAFL